jgi:hypothetical protein
VFAVRWPLKHLAVELTHTHSWSIDQALFYERARLFLASAKSPLALYALDLPCTVLALMTVDPSGWLFPPSSFNHHSSSHNNNSNHSNSSPFTHHHHNNNAHGHSPLSLLLGEEGDVDAWKVIKDRIAESAGSKGGSTVGWGASGGAGSGGGSGGGYATTIRDELRSAMDDEAGGGLGVWLFSVREERGFLLQWPK